MSSRTFQEVLTEAVRDISENGYDDLTRINEWLKRLRIAALVDLPTEEEVRTRMELAMDAVFRRNFTKTAMLRHHPGVPLFTIERIKPQLRSELDRRILASVNLIKINREQAVEKMLQRASGWATSIPDGGSRVVDKIDVKEGIAKSIKQVRYEERRVTIDQGHKLISSINAVIAQQTGAIAAEWNSRWKRPGYDYRKDHKERDGKIYAIRGSWAMEQGLINKGDGYTDEITAPAEEVACQCSYTYLNALRELPDRMLTEKGRKLLEETRIKRKVAA
ncbi:hypothetical protein SAMN05216466_10788 [Paraburkholderia phenazinium]|uniref:Phage Mu protein F like protein n=1 Tax=Paraburkholderia phenazinium TaxID=60549 RepID=A0A1G7ZLW3_9BURK|nr:hypothetical protein [Paraburkholderia phenazinium]SDH09751.1 hypothetical protein SAMN05216466_10788 [Paraburkholderia phenazinium]